MNVGKTLFAQLMDFLPWTTFSRIVERHEGTVNLFYPVNLATGTEFFVIRK